MIGKIHYVILCTIFFPIILLMLIFDEIKSFVKIPYEIYKFYKYEMTRKKLSRTKTVDEWINNNKVRKR